MAQVLCGTLKALLFCLRSLQAVTTGTLAVLTTYTDPGIAARLPQIPLLWGFIWQLWLLWVYSSALWAHAMYNAHYSWCWTKSRTTFAAIFSWWWVRTRTSFTCRLGLAYA